MNKAHLYIRVSTMDQAVEGISLDIQDENNWQWFERNLRPLGIERGLTIRDEGQSASKKHLFRRKEGRQLADNALVSSGDHVIFVRLDRSFRNMQDFANSIAEFARRGIVCHFVSTPVNLNSTFGKAFAQMMVTCAEIESAIKSERMREVFEYHRRHLANIPYGHNFRNVPGLKIRKVNGRSAFVKDPEEFEVYLYFLRMAATGKYAMYKLADMCDKYYHELRGIEYKPSAFTPRLWPDARSTSRRYEYQEFHQNSLKHFYGNRPEFSLPVPKRFEGLKKRYRDMVEQRRQRLPGNNPFQSFGA